MKKNLNSLIRTLFGICLVGAGIIAVGNLFNWWHISSSGWWAFFLIVPGVASIISKGFTTVNTVLTLFGVWLFGFKQGWFDFIPREAIFAVLCVALGVVLIIKPFWKKKNIEFSHSPHSIPISHSAQSKSDEFPEASAVFSGQTLVYDGLVRGGSFTTVFGGMEIHLENASVQDGTIIKATTVFGGIDIHTGGKYRVICRGTSVLGGTEDKSSGRNRVDLPVIYLEHEAVFGGIDITD